MTMTSDVPAPTGLAPGATPPTGPVPAGALPPGPTARGTAPSSTAPAGTAPGDPTPSVPSWVVGPVPRDAVPVAPRLDDDLRLVAPALTGGPALLAAPVSAATWRAVSQATVGFVVLLPVGIAVMVLVPLAVGLLVLGVGFPLLVGTLAATRPFARAERARLRAQLGVEIAAPQYRRAAGRGWRPAWRAVLTDARSWSHVAYATLGLWLASIEVVVLWGFLGGSLALVGLPLYGARQDLGALVLAALGVAGIWIGAVTAQALALLHVRAARGLLGWPRSAAAVDAARDAARAAQERASLAEVRAEHLTQTRTRAVGTADDDRRRIERDLHDGAQQRLVALGVELGAARRTAATDPEAAAAALDHAHREVKETLAELRDLVRGIHPAVLTDRGLDAALSALAARCPVPVAVEVPDPASLTAASPTAQAAAYFVTAEALTNVARHSGATNATVRAQVTGGRLRLEIVDDGRGGAVARPGSGLEGLRSRVEVLDGTLTLDSPVGGGTRMTVEMPCAS
jgi:signal transduction histidine kinase